MKKQLIILTTIALAAGVTACSSLDLKPKDRVTQFDYFKNATDLELFTNPYYNEILKKDKIHDVYEQQSDQIIGNTLSAILYGGNHRTVPATGGGWTWTDLRRINTLIKYADQCEDKAAVLQYTALSRFFRAFFYFEKVMRFGDVPWYDYEIGSADEELYKPRDSREYVMTKMLEDIDFAITSGGLSEAKSPYRVNKWAALALKARFCLYEGTYRKYHGLELEGNNYQYYLDLAADAAKEIIEKGPYKLYSTGDPDKDYLMLFAEDDASNDEYILALNYEYEMGIRHNASAFTLLPTQGRPGLTRKFVNTYLMKDGTAFTNQAGWQEKQFIEETENRDPRLAQSIRTPGYTRIGKTEVEAPNLGLSVTGYQPIKFVQAPTASNSNNDRVDSSDCDLPVFRFAEVLLIYAEAKAELGTITQDDLNISIKLLRDRVGMPNMNLTKANSSPDRYLLAPETGYPNVTGANAGIILEIRRERSIELLQEGFRLDDLVRWKAGTCIDQDLMGMYFPGPGQYDLTGDGKPDIALYVSGTIAPSKIDQVYEIDKDVFLSNGNKGYVFFHKNVERTKFNEVRDYHYPIPINERSLNPNLTQNPGWSDGLDF